MEKLISAKDPVNEIPRGALWDECNTQPFMLGDLAEEQGTFNFSYAHDFVNTSADERPPPGSCYDLDMPSAKACGLDYVFAVDIAVAEGQPEGEEGQQGEAHLSVFANLSCDMRGKAVLDIGATATVGSLQAIEFIGESETLRVFPGCQRQFRFGNGHVSSSLSYVELPQRLDGHLIHLGIHTIDAEGVPVLLSIKTLKKLGAIIDVARRLVIFQSVNARVAVRLQESPSGHLLLDLCSDWMSGAVSLDRFWGEETQVREQTSHSKTEGAYMICPASEQFPLTQSEINPDPLQHEQAHAIVNPHVNANDSVADSDLAVLVQTVQALELCFEPLISRVDDLPEQGDHGNHSRGRGAEGQGASQQELIKREGETGFETSSGDLARLLQDSRHRSPKPPCGGGTVHGGPCPGAHGPWFKVREERARRVGCMQNMSHTPILHPGLRSHCSASQPGATAKQCDRGAEGSTANSGDRKRRWRS